MWWASVVSGWPRSCRASVAIRSGRVEMGTEPWAPTWCAMARVAGGSRRERVHHANHPFPSWKRSGLARRKWPATLRGVTPLGDKRAQFGTCHRFERRSTPFVGQGMVPGAAPASAERRRIEG
jgi:hypothetical protein